MQLKTSCSKYLNGTLLRKNLSRFWPMWAVYAAAWLLAAPVSQFLTLFGVNARYMGSTAKLADEAASNLLNSATYMGLWMAVLFGCLFAMALFSYLYTPRSVGMMHSFPIRREGLFLTNYLTGLAVFAATLTVSALLTAALQAAAGVLVWRTVGLWLLCTAGQMLFFYSFAVFCAMFTGQVLAVPVFFVAWNAVVYVLNTTVQNFAGMFLYGYSSGGTPVWVEWLTPIFRLTSQLRVTSEWDEALECSVDHALEGMGILGVYAAVGVVFALGALAVYRVRRSETAGDTVSIGWARQLFRLGVGICAALTFGQWLYLLIRQEFFYSSNGAQQLPLAVLCMVLLGLVGFYGAEMLLCKSFRVFRTGWKGAILTAAIVVALGVGVRLDVTGIETRIPDAGEIESLELSIGGTGYIFGTVTDQETIQKFRELHQELIDMKEEELQREEQHRFGEGGFEDGVWATAGVSFDYHLKETSLRREYQVYYYYSELEQPDSLIAHIAALVSDPTVQRASLTSYYDSIEEGRMPLEAMMEDMTAGEMEYVQTVYPDTSGWETGTYPFEESIAREVFAAVLRDIDAGRAGQTMFLRDGWDQVYENTLSFRYRDRDGAYRYLGSISITPAYTETAAALREHGIVNENRPLITRGELSALWDEMEETELSASEIYGETAQTSDATAGVSGTVVYQHPETGELVLVLPETEEQPAEEATR